MEATTSLEHPLPFPRKTVSGPANFCSMPRTPTHSKPFCNVVSDAFEYIRSGYSSVAANTEASSGDEFPTPRPAARVKAEAKYKGRAKQAMSALRDALGLGGRGAVPQAVPDILFKASETITYVVVVSLSLRWLRLVVSTACFEIRFGDKEAAPSHNV